MSSITQFGNTRNTLPTVNEYNRIITENKGSLIDFKFLAVITDSTYVKSYKLGAIDPNKHLEVYTDGSFKKELKCYTSGIVIAQEGEPKTFILSKGDYPDKLRSNNIGGECNSVEILCHLGLDKRFSMGETKPTMELVCDLEHVKKWASGEYKAKVPCSIRMKKSLDELEKTFDINYRWVKGHNGSYFNELADMLCSLAYYLD